MFSGLRVRAQEMLHLCSVTFLIDRLIRVGAMETEEEVKDRDVAGGEQAGILSAMATKIGMAMPGANGDDSHGGSGDDAKSSNGEAARGGSNGGEKQGGESNGGGILSAVASRIGVAVSGANGDRSGSAEDGAKTSAGDAGHGSKSEEKGRGVNGGRIVEQIISNLPSGIYDYESYTL